METVQHHLQDDGTFPNNARLPLLVYPGAVRLPARDPAAAFEQLFAAHGWPDGWRNGVFGRHHYHSTAHEVLGVYGGRAEIQFGGPHGPVLAVTAGDVVVIPAGVAHKRISASADFAVVGAYPAGQRPDLCHGETGERPRADRNIARVQLPEADPVQGADGALRICWAGQR